MTGQHSRLFCSHSEPHCRRESDFPQPVRAPKGAPNVLVLLDDVGFGATSTFGKIDKVTIELK